MIRAEYIDHMGSDLTVVNAARVSFDKESEWECWCHKVEGKPTFCTEHAKDQCGSLADRDVKLIQFLARGMSTKEYAEILTALAQTNDMNEVVALVKRLDVDKHWTPFAHPQITLRETVPVFVARQRFKHTVGFVYNEISRRYVADEPQTYFTDPRDWRKASTDKKQGSSEETVNILDGSMTYTVPDGDKGGKMGAGAAVYSVQYAAVDVYRWLVEDKKVCPEQARMVLPQSMMTSYYVTGSLAAWARFYKQRTNPHAQKEIQILARQAGKIIEPLYPVSWKALTA